MAGATFDFIASYTVATAENNIVFSNIPQNFTDLVILGKSRITTTASQSNLVFNSYRNSSHGTLALSNNGGSGLIVSREFNRTQIDGAGAIGSSNTIGWFSPNEYHIFSYSDTTKFKAVLSFGMSSSNGNTLDYCGHTSNVYPSLDPITTITVTTNGTAFDAGSSWTIYGIRGK